MLATTVRHLQRGGTHHFVTGYSFGRTLKEEVMDRGRMCGAGFGGSSGLAGVIHGFDRVRASTSERSTSERSGLFRQSVKSGGKARCRA